MLGVACVRPVIVAAGAALVLTAVEACAQAPLLDPGWQIAPPGAGDNAISSGFIARTFGYAPGQYAVPRGYQPAPANVPPAYSQQQQRTYRTASRYYAIVPAQDFRAYRQPSAQYYAIVPVQQSGGVQPAPTYSRQQPAELTTGQTGGYQLASPQVAAYQGPPQPNQQPFLLEQIFGPHAWAPANAPVPPGSPDQSYPSLDPKFERQVVDYPTGQPAGTVIIDTPHFFLYLVMDGGKALRYGIGVGRSGFTWAGVKEVSAKREWPDWRPPDEMLQRRPDLPRYMPGGPDNPLGARALYLGSTLYRIHGSNEPWTIGTQVSSGCIRLRNDDVIDLYGRVKIGAKVIVI